MDRPDQFFTRRYWITWTELFELCLTSKAKTTKKITLKIECSACGTKRFQPLKRAKKFEYGAEKKAKKGSMLNF